ncbi:MAG: hypothetical protein ACXV7G_13480, partial [Halobacteriota archaeon]
RPALRALSQGKKEVTDLHMYDRVNHFRTARPSFITRRTFIPPDGRECNNEEQSAALCEKEGDVSSSCSKIEHDGDS